MINTTYLVPFPHDLLHMAQGSQRVQTVVTRLIKHLIKLYYKEYYYFILPGHVCWLQASLSDGPPDSGGQWVGEAFSLPSWRHSLVLVRLPFPQETLQPDQEFQKPHSEIVMIVLGLDFCPLNSNFSLRTWAGLTVALRALLCHLGFTSRALVILNRSAKKKY